MSISLISAFLNPDSPYATGMTGNFLLRSQTRATQLALQMTSTARGGTYDYSIENPFSWIYHNYIQPNNYDSMHLIQQFTLRPKNQTLYFMKPFMFYL
jgi:hypothetical protein